MGRHCPIGDQRIHEVRQPAHEAEGRFGAKFFGPYAAGDIFLGFGDEE